MADEELATDPALETPASEEQQQVETPETETTVEETEVEGEEGQDETDELDFGFEKYLVPKKLKEAVEALRADATTKQQGASARQKALDEREQQLTQQAEVSEAELDDRSSARSINAEIERFKDYDYAAYQQHYRQDPYAAGEAWSYKTHLIAQKAELDGKLGKYATERTEKAHQDLGKRVQETLAEAPKIIPGFKPEMIGKLAEFATGEMKIPEAAIKANWSPTFLRLVHLANVGFELSKKAAAKPVAAVVPAQPLTTVVAKSSPPPTGLSDKLSTDEWMKRRNKQIETRQRA